MCILVIALECHPAFPFICCHNRDEDRDRPSLEDRLEEDTKLLCGRDAQAGGFVLGMHTLRGFFGALTNCRCLVRWSSTERTSRGLLVEHVALEGPKSVESFLRGRKIDPYHLVAGEIFTQKPEVHYFWSNPADGDGTPPPASRVDWSVGHLKLGPGVFVVSNENRAEGSDWPKSKWLKQEVGNFLAKIQDSSSLQELQTGLSQIMSRFDVPGLGPPTGPLPRVFSKEVEMSLHSGPFSAWRPNLITHFGTVSQRILICEGHTHRAHYFHRSTNEFGLSEGPPAKGPWHHVQVCWKDRSIGSPCCGAAWDYFSRALGGGPARL